MKNFRGFLGLVMVSVFASSAWAVIPQLINFQGVLTTPGGTPVPNGPYPVTFRIYDAAAGGNVLWTEAKTVTTTGGVFTTLLGSLNPVPDSAFNDSSRYLGITVAPDAEMAPRQKLTSVAFANRVGSIFGATGGVTVETGDSTDTLLTLADQGDGDIEMVCPVPPAPPGICPPFVLTTIGSAVTAGALRIMGCTGTWTIRGNGWNGDFTARGKATFGPGHVNSGIYSFIAGAYNTVTAGSDQATIPGGYCNIAAGDYATAGGGTANTAGADYTTVSGGNSNSAINTNATIGGGSRNSAVGPWSTIGGGDNNVINQPGVYDFIGGGSDNATSFTGAGHQVIGGGEKNIISSGLHNTIGGGLNNAIINNVNANVIGGGWQNFIFNHWAVIGGGHLNTVNGRYAVVGGGQYDTANGWWTAIGGGQNNVASGDYSTIPGGLSNLASGEHSFAAGTNARAVDTCSFVWSDCCRLAGSILAPPFYSNGSNTFNVRATGGVYFITNCDSVLSPVSTGVILPAGGSAWSSLSDSTLKRNMGPVNGAEILSRLAELPVNRWSYKSQDAGIEHVGPMAQDFFRLFGLGEDNRHISTLDPDGIALAAAKELYSRSLAQQALIATLKAQVSLQASEFSNLKSQLAALQTTLEEVLAAQANQGDMRLSSVTDAASEASLSR